MWNQIKDKVYKLRPTKNLLQCKNKIRNSKEAYKRAEKKICVEMSWKSRGSNKLELITEKLKQTATKNRPQLMKKEKIKRLEKTEVK